MEQAEQMLFSFAGISSVLRTAILVGRPLFAGVCHDLITRAYVEPLAAEGGRLPSGRGLESRNKQDGQRSGRGRSPLCNRNPQYINMIKNTSLLLIGALVAATSTSSWALDKAEQASRGAVDERDRKFITEAAQGGLLEVFVGKLTEQKTQNAEIKRLGGMLVKDHGKANEELRKLAEARGVTVPMESDRKHADVFHKIATEEGEKFDRAFVSELDKAHREDIALFEKEASEGTDPELKAFASKTLPTLQAHESHIKAVEGK